jgi:hypothetical protein
MTSFLLNEGKIKIRDVINRPWWKKSIPLLWAHMKDKRREKAHSECFSINGRLTTRINSFRWALRRIIHWAVSCKLSTFIVPAIALRRCMQPQAHHLFDLHLQNLVTTINCLFPFQLIDDCDTRFSGRWRMKRDGWAAASSSPVSLCAAAISLDLSLRSYHLLFSYELLVEKRMKWRLDRSS